LFAQCPYPEAFEPAPPKNSDRLSNFTDIPRPFVFDPPADVRAQFRPGETVEFRLTVVGRASRLTPYFVSAFRKLADDGLGPKRARFDLKEVVAQAPGEVPMLHGIEAISVYKDTEPLVRSDAPKLRASNLVRPADLKQTRLTLRFSTPVDLRDHGAAVVIPEFAPIVRRLRDRASSLAAFFGDGPLELDFKGVSALAETVRLVENCTRVVTVNRRSSKTGHRHDIGGFVGEATYQGDAIGRLMPLIRVGELMHVGKHAAFGNGRIEVIA
jgi:hypothetical protein